MFEKIKIKKGGNPFGKAQGEHDSPRSEERLTDLHRAYLPTNDPTDTKTITITSSAKSTGNKKKHKPSKLQHRESLVEHRCPSIRESIRRHGVKHGQYTKAYSDS